MLLRLVFALLLSLSLAVLFAWGWDRSDARPESAAPRLLTSSGALPLR